MGKKKKSIKELAEGLKAYEERKKAARDADFTDLESFKAAYLNEPDSKKRKKLVEEYKKRHAEFAEFLNENGELVSADAKITATVQAVLSGAAEEADNAEASNLFEKIREGLR
ncbi:MAG: hypothetical protein IJ496_09535 [Ruminococcus sp.]|nr:hypothetical protein [Ruminococcus sp.]